MTVLLSRCPSVSSSAGLNIGPALIFCSMLAQMSRVLTITSTFYSDASCVIGPDLCVEPFPIHVAFEAMASSSAAPQGTVHAVRWFKAEAHVHWHIYIYIYICMCIYICIWTYTHVFYIYICIYIYIYIYICPTAYQQSCHRAWVVRYLGELVGESVL